MKKILMLTLVIAIALLPALSLAANSRQNRDIPQTKVVDVVPENEGEPVVPPKVDIVEDTEKITELQEEMQTLFRLTIRYVYADGSEAAPTYDRMLQEGAAYDVTSPSISGYTPSMAQVAGTMPGRNVMYTVVYLSPEKTVDLFDFSRMQNLFSWEDYETPLGLGFSILNVGICIE